ncbi:MAG: isocitrate/isopropylmalate dehydrogenase family protein [Clostridia bacterium]|nr:isocitrate/isopropylmalate dehydrogenase family protein [Clostridia bacterium]
MAYKIGLCYGDAIGPEITKATEVMLKAGAEKVGLDIETPVYLMGWEGIEKYNDPVPQITIDGLKTCDAWVFGPHDSAAYPKEFFERANPSGTMRHVFDLYSNARPAKVYPGVSPKKVKVDPASDIVIFRENSEGALPDRNKYRGWGEFMPTEDLVLSISVTSRKATVRLAHEAFKCAMKRKKHLTIVHKANIIQWAYGFFRSTIKENGAQYYPGVRIDDYHIDASTAHLVRHMQDFGVIIITNLFGDILSDLAGELTGSLELGAGINTNDHRCMAQAAHGSAPDIVTPTGLMLSGCMMFAWPATNRNDPKFAEAAKIMEKAVLDTMAACELTPDMNGTESTSSYAEKIAERIRKA